MLLDHSDGGECVIQNAAADVNVCDFCLTPNGDGGSCDMSGLDVGHKFHGMSIIIDEIVE